MNFAIFFAGFVSALLGAMGLGGGGVLLIYLTALTSTPQLMAQGINLIFFLPIGVIAALMHVKNRLIDKKIAIFTTLGALPSAALGVYISGIFDEKFLSKIFAVFLLYLGLKEIITSFSKTKSAHRK